MPERQRSALTCQKDGCANVVSIKKVLFAGYGICHHVSCSMWYGPERPKWLGPIPYEYPAHLTGGYPADYGFDILNLGVDPSNFQKYFK